MIALFLLDMLEQPTLEPLRVRVVVHDGFEDFPFDGKPDGIGRLVAFAVPSASFGGIEGREQSSADIGGTKAGG